MLSSWDNEGDHEQKGSTVDSPLERALKDHAEKTADSGKPAPQVDMTFQDRPTSHVLPMDETFSQIARIERETWGMDLTDADHDQLPE